MTSFSSVHICISFRLLRRGNMKLHALLGYPVSENFVSWCQTLKNSSASFLCIQETLIISTISQFESDSKMCTLQKCICVWSLDNWSQILSGKPFNTFSQILSGKPFNTFSMARLKTLQFRLTLTPLSSDSHSPFVWPSLPFRLTLTPLSSDPHSPFHCHACISYLSFTILFSGSVIGVVRVSSAVRPQALV
jgi:hypothetical protein